MIKVLVTHGEHRAALAVVRSLGRHGIKTIVVSEHKRNISAASRYCYRFYKCRPARTDENGFLEDIKDIIEQERVSAILPITDVAMYLLLDPAHRIPAELTTFLPSYELFSLTSDKYQLLKLCKELNINIPETHFIENLFQIEYYRDRLKYPIVIKPARSVRKIGDRWGSHSISIANNYYELIVKCYRGIIYNYPFLLQEKVMGNAYGVFTVYQNGHPLAYFGHKRLREKPPSGGVSVLCESVLINPQLQLATEKLLKTIQWHGPAMVEFKYDEHNQIYYVMEINGRFWGSLQLAIDAGVDFPWLLFDQNRTIHPATAYKIGVKLRWLLGDLDHHLIKSKAESNYYHKIMRVIKFFTYHDKNTKLELLRISDIRPFLCELNLYVKDFLRSLITSLQLKIRIKIIDRIMDYFLRLLIRMNPDRKFLTNKLPLNLKKILFVCYGNMYRSPFAEHYLRKITDSLYCISSAGLNASANISSPHQAVQMAKRFNLDLSNHQAKDFTKLTDDQFDLIFVMERSQKKQLKGYGKNIIELGLLGNRNNISFNIPDPFGKSDEFVYEVYKTIAANLDQFKEIYFKNSNSVRTG